MSRRDTSAASGDSASTDGEGFVSEMSVSDSDDTDRPIRVLQLASSEESFFTQQVEALEAYGVDCSTLVVQGDPAEDDPRGLRAYLNSYRQLLSEVDDSYDLVHANYGLVGPLALAQPVRPVVLTLWGSEVMGYSNRLDRITRFAARHSDAVIAPNEAVSRRLDCDHEVVPFGVDLDLFRPIDRKEARKRLGWNPSKQYVLFPYDTDREVKNFERAERIVSEAVVNAELKQISGRDYEEMPYLMNACDALLVTSVRESGPMVVREAAACNVPVVSTDVGFAADTLAGVTNSYVADTDSELVAALEAVLRSAGRSDGRERITEHTTRRMATQLYSIYRDLLDDTAGVRTPPPLGGED